MALRKGFSAIGLLATILIVPILILTVLLLATHEGRTPPPAITGLIATDASYIRHGQIDLFWSPSDAKDFAYYNIYASETEITDVTELSPVSRINDRTDVTYKVTRYRVPGLSLALFAFMEDTEYWFAVTAVDSAGNESKVGTSVSATIETMPLSPPIPAAFIIVTDIGFQPETVTVLIGTTVAWTNLDRETIYCFFVVNPHTVTSDTGLFHFEFMSWDPVYGYDFTAEVIFTYTFTEAGVFGYHCELHPGETGEVIVEEVVEEPERG